jgi:trans-AT polyketide synthase/acyltransferase/oxidoreductase domain-containing protein
MTASVRPRWTGERQPRADAAGVQGELGRLDEPCYVVRSASGVATVAGGSTRPGAGHEVLAMVPPLPPGRLGSPDFLRDHGVRAAYMTGAMANGISSEELVIALARSGYLSSFGAAGLLPDRIDTALRRLAREIPGLPFACNLIHSPSELEMERTTVELLLRHQVRTVEASAFMALTPNIVEYRLAGLRRDRAGRTVADNRVMAKVSRPEVAEQFLRPAPDAMLNELVARGRASAEQAVLARSLPVADDITAEADSGGHTDRRSLTTLAPTLVRLRNRLRAELRYAQTPRVGAAGGLGTPESVGAAFALGVDYVVTGSVNQACLEAGASTATKAMLARAGIADVDMAPAADMFELGVELQVLKTGTLFPMRAQKLYQLYRGHDSMDDLPAAERHRLETQIFRRPLAAVWDDCVEFFERRDPAQLERAAGNPKRRMALVFRWYLGMSSRWSNVGDPDRVMDYQVWCGPAMGAFNDWTAGTYLAAPANRRVADVAHHLMHGAAYLGRSGQLQLAGVRLPASCLDYRPEPLTAAEPAPVLVGAR